ncbi:hypothetical protein CFK37_17615 [Virgibacillus phasianinus]|uniref:Uncharacterized protein n=1 Tax=Virgibacillus phasianinus TaxID=2017483 RepID=A0A220U7H8_9BACI|nr:hypothetical protein [Virgibacillus phasianinus]ASK63846.1 hypothetical protein CFK37_17615 [Virgibacillus phasianinus]
MTNFVQKAVLNNIDWCKRVCETHGMKHISKENVWGLLEKAPTYYPEIITANRDSPLDEINFFLKNGKVSSVKDSYANLNLKPLGFEILFEAEWIYHEPLSNRGQVNKWRIITTDRELEQWTTVSGLDTIIKSEYQNKRC